MKDVKEQGTVPYYLTVLCSVVTVAVKTSKIKVNFCCLHPSK